jgi:hypothetical protein
MVTRVVQGAVALGAVLFVITLLPDLARYAKLRGM